jgi:putative endonuclease
MEILLMAAGKMNNSSKLPSLNDKRWQVYLIETKSGKLYTGITNDLERRFNAHNGRGKGARFFHFSDPLRIVYAEECANRSEASKRECVIKKMSRQEKLSLITSPSPSGSSVHIENISLT